MERGCAKGQNLSTESELIKVAKLPPPVLVFLDCIASELTTSSLHSYYSHRHEGFWYSVSMAVVGTQNSCGSCDF